MNSSPSRRGPGSGESSNSNAWTTTVLADNIHCSSCATRIDEIVHGLSPDVLNVRVDILSHEIHVLHRPGVTPAALCAALCDEAFEVSAAKTVDQEDHVVFETTFPAAPAGWWDHLSTLPNVPGTSCFQVPTRTKRKRHEENCVACQAAGDGTTSGTDLDLGPKPRPAKTSDRVSIRSASSKGKQIVREPPPAFSLPRLTPPKRGSDGLDKTSADETMLQQPIGARRQFCVTLTVGGMTCASCVNAINAALKELDFVRDVKVDLLSNSAVVQYTGDQGLASKIEETIGDIGYEAAIVQVTETSTTKNDETVVASRTESYRVVLGISGMTCASCVNAITEGLKALDFVRKVNVALLTNSAEVVVSDKEKAPELVEKVEDLGYEATIQSCDAIEFEAGDQRSHGPDQRQVQIQIDGMFCPHCPPRIVEKLEQEWPAALTIEKPATLKAPTMSIRYQPHVPDFTIRDIIAAIDQLHEGFKASVYRPPTLEDRSRKMKIAERNRTLQRLLLSAICAVPSLLIGVVWMSLVSEEYPMRKYFETPIWAGQVSRAEWAMFVLATPVYFLAADVFHVRALREIRALWRPGSKVPILRRFYRFGSMNLLISAGTTVAYISSLALLVIKARSQSGATNGDTYFDSVVFLTFFILIGRYLEALGKSQAGNTVAMLGKLRPQEAILATASGPTSEVEKPDDARHWAQTISAGLLEVEDTVIVPHGASPPADGVIVSGDGKFDESSLTGESRPVTKAVGDKVFVGTVNTGGPIKIEVTELGGASMLDQIVAVVREGQTKRAPIERFADVLTGYFVPVITALAITTFFVWFGLGQSGRLGDQYVEGQDGGWAFWSLQFAIAVFVVACPCGIGLAAPTSLFVGCGLAARHGILVRGGGEAFQDASDLDAVVFDKTGTLTEGGMLQVTDHEVLSGANRDVCMTIAAALEELSSHPIARAVHRFASTTEPAAIHSTNVEEIPGLGLCGTFALPDHFPAPRSYDAAIGSEAFIESFSPSLLGSNTFASQTLATWKSNAKSVAVLALRPSPSLSSDGDEPWTIAALFATTDPIRPSALPTIQALQARRIAVFMLSGDNPATARAVASGLGIPVANVFAGVLPTAKADKVRELRRSTQLGRRGRGGRAPRVAFVGDGINDAPALVAATVSISLAGAAPIALSSSSFVLLSQGGRDANAAGDASLAGLVTILDLSRRVLRRVRANFAWALVYNVVLVPVAAGVFFRVGGGGWRLSPVWAAAAMALSSVSVVLSSLALRLEWTWSWRFWKRTV